tara:strand:+ start:418 stop:648 length:231 start_codon:yes stop_codon:yes gene_type:complete
MIREQQKVSEYDGIKLNPGQQIIHTIRADKFTMRSVTIAEKNCVLTSHQVNWLDPISDIERTSSQNEIFLTGGENI